MPQTRHKSIDEKLESSEVESLGIDEQLEINISGRKFSISLKGFEPNAIVEIKELLETQSVDLLDLMRAYLNSVHSRCELESQVAHITQKIAQKLPQVFITKDFDEAQDGQADDEVDSELDEEDLAQYSELDEDLAEGFGDDFGGFGEEFGHSGEVYGAFGEFNMLGGLGIHSKSEIEPSEEELDEIMAQKEQESQSQKVQNQEAQDKEYEIAEANEEVKTTKSAKTIEAAKKEQKDEQVKQADDSTQAQQTQKEHTDKKPNYETMQSKNSLENQPQNQSQNQLVQNQMLENQSLENHSQSLTNQALQAPKAKFDQARFDFADFSKPNPNKNEAQNLETESKASDSKARPKEDLQVNSKAHFRAESTDSKNDLKEGLDFCAKPKADSKEESSKDTKESELSHAGQAHSTFANRANNSFDFMSDSPALEPKPKSTLSRITKFFKNP